MHKDTDTEWFPIKGHEGYYWVTKCGRIKSKYRERSLFIDKKGYVLVTLFKKCRVKTMQVHRIVALTFIPNPHNKPQVNHLNEIKGDNRVENLEWCTQSENINHGTGIERRKNKISQKVYQYDLCKNLIKVWPSQNETERHGYSRRNIWYCLEGRSKTCQGYIWSREKLGSNRNN